MKSRVLVPACVTVASLVATVSVSTHGVSTRTAHAFMRPATLPRSGCGLGMVAIPGGEYDLGETKRHATVEAFCLDIHEVTVADYRSCAGRGGCSAEGLARTQYSTCNWERTDREKHPVNCATWFQADAYCKAMGKRLPSEEEWEWAARGGTRAFTYAWGNDAKESEAWCWRGSKRASTAWPDSTCAVMQFPANPFGVYDLSGNLWEWTSTARVGGSSPTGVAEAYYVFRGGSWGSTDVIQARADIRGGDGASWRDPDVGFRCALNQR